MLHTVPLQSLLDWLSKPKGPNLVKRPWYWQSLRKCYMGNSPLLWEWASCTSHTTSPVPFSVAYMWLNVWHSAGSNEESEDKLTASCLLFVSISEMSDVVPIVVQHPVLLDVACREAMEDTGEPMSPLSFREFRLHTAWTQQPGGELTHHITFPCFLGEGNSPLLEYELEKFPQGLRQGQKRVLSLKPPSPDHWTIASDLIIPLALDESR